MIKKIEESIKRVKNLIPLIDNEETKAQAEYLLLVAQQNLPLINENDLNNYQDLESLQQALDVIERIYFENVAN